MNSAHAEVTSGSSSAEYGKQVSTEFGVKGSYGAFDGAAQASLESISTQRHKQYRRTSNIKFRHQHMSLDVFEPWSLLSPAAKKFLLNAPIDRLHDRLGDFYALEITLGGVFQQTTIATMFEGEESFQAEARIQASYDAIVAAADISFSKGGISTKKQGNETFESRLKALGGDTSIFLKLNGHNREDLQIEWANSFRDHENDFPVGFRLAPIWDLLDSEDMNPAKAQELKRLMTDKWSSVPMPNFPGIPRSTSWFAGMYEVWYRGGRRLGADMIVDCNGVTSGNGGSGTLEFNNVASRCTETRDASATIYIQGLHGANKHECLRRDGTTIRGSHFNTPTSFWGEVEYRLITPFQC